jgi:cytochrome P450
MQDPAPFLAELRRESPVCWLPGFDAWLVTSHAEVQLLFADPRITTDPRIYDAYQAPTEPGAEKWLSELPFRSNPSDPETLGRRLVSAALTPRAIARIEDRIQEVVERFAAPLRGRHGVVDLFGEFTEPVTARVLGRILGVTAKAADDDRFLKLARNATRVLRPIISDRKRRETEAAMVEICEYVLELVERRRLDPRIGLISDLVEASHSSTPASAEDIVKVVAGLVSVGTGTTNIAAVRGLRALLMNPDQLDLLRDAPSLLPDAVSELLRYDNGIVLMTRYVDTDFELRGQALRRGQLVLLCVLGANRDPAVFDDPEQLDLRRDTKEALTFGRGPHFCIGANIARAELRLMIAAALEFLPPGARLLEDQIRWTQKGLLSQLKTLPVDFGG